MWFSDLWLSHIGCKVEGEIQLLHIHSFLIMKVFRFPVASGIVKVHSTLKVRACLDTSHALQSTSFMYAIYKLVLILPIYRFLQRIKSNKPTKYLAFCLTLQRLTNFSLLFSFNINIPVS